MQDLKNKPMPNKTIVVKAETYQTLVALKMVPQEPFDSVIHRLLERNTDLIKTMPSRILAPDQPCLMPTVPAAVKAPLILNPAPNTDDSA